MKRKGLTAAETSATQKSGIRLSSPMLTGGGAGETEIRRRKSSEKSIEDLKELSFLIDLFEAAVAGN